MPNHYAYRFGDMPHHKHPFMRPPLVCHPGIYPPICYLLAPKIVPPVAPILPIKHGHIPLHAGGKPRGKRR